MPIRSRRRIKVSFFGIVATVLLVGAPMAVAGAVAPTVYSARTGAQVTLPTSGGVFATVETLALPRGSWTITANATVVDFGAGDFVRCALDNGGVEFDGGSTTYVSGTVADVSNAGVVKATAPVVITFTCGHDHAGNIGQFYLDPGATLTAVAANGPIKGAAAAIAQATPAVVQQRTTAQVPLTGGLSGTTVLSAHLPAGTWAIRTNLSAVDFGGFDFVSCDLIGTADGVLGQTQAGVGNGDVLVTNLALQGVQSSTSAGNVKIVCSNYETTTLYIDPGATLIATRVSAPTDLVAVPASGATLSDTGGKPTKLFHQAMPAGAWRVSSTVTTYVHNPNNSIGGETDFVRCGLRAGTKAIDGGATVLITVPASDGGNYEQEIVNTGTYTAKKPWTLTLSCSHDATISDGSHWIASTFNPTLALQQGPIRSTVS